jgi:hypothetical protein
MRLRHGFIQYERGSGRAADGLTENAVPVQVVNEGK